MVWSRIVKSYSNWIFKLISCFLKLKYIEEIYKEYDAEKQYMYYTTTLSQWIDWLKMEFSFKFAVLALQFNQKKTDCHSMPGLYTHNVWLR